MFLLPKLCTPSTGESMSPDDVAAVVANGHIVGKAARNGTLGTMLRGRKLALLAECDDEPDTQLYVRAATEMGAQVAHLRSGLSTASPVQEVQTTARMLGQLYDALECQGLDLDLAQQIALHAGVPVFYGLASEQHCTASLVTQLMELSGPDMADGEARLRLVQAVLLGALT